MADLTQAAQGVSRSIGRYFSIVSTVPSVLLVSWVYLLTASGAWTHPPNPRAAAQAVTDLSLGAVAALALVSLALGIVLHPLQYAFVQLLEGYWGVSTIAQRWRALRMLRYRRRLVGLRDAGNAAKERLRQFPDDADDADDEARVPWISLRDEAERLEMDRPQTLEETMPTRLGNALRFYEWRAGKAWGIEAISAMPYISRVAAAGDMEYVNDQRSQLDLAVRTMLISSVAFVVTAVPLLTDGWWLLVALAPYGAAYLSYRGAVVAADEYGRSLAVVIALNRFALYDRLRVPTPADTIEERENNSIVNAFFGYGDGPRISFRYPGSGPPRTSRPSEEHGPP